ncbi:MAG: SIS domain-containing protein, partial [Candidatus Dormibacteraeota bacterium]|nr:SIS domain-containing protein [Candidatus Dormibacteraeota bacterium]
CRALPAISLGNDVAAVSSLLRGPDPDSVWSQQVEVFGRRGDILLAFAGAPLSEAVRRALRAARDRGLLSVVLLATTLDCASGADHQLTVATDDRHLAEEVNLATYHMLWELVHIVLNHRGIPNQLRGVDDSDAAAHCITCADTLTAVIVDFVSGSTATGRDGEGHVVEVSLDLLEDVAPGEVVLCHGGVALQRQERSSVVDALYPMLSERPSATQEVVRGLATAPLEKARESNRLRGAVLDTQGNRLAECAVQLAGLVRSGGTLLVLGNGGSAAAAAELAALCLAPPAGFSPIAALALTNDIATVTAVGNDVGFADIFTRQLIALARDGDVMIAFSTSGSSENLVRAVEYAGQRGLVSVAIAGYDGGQVAQQPTLDHSFVVPSNSVHRIQEVQATIAHTLWRMVHANLVEH